MVSICEGWIQLDQNSDILKAVIKHRGPQKSGISWPVEELYLFMKEFVP
jgi:hypothetical protein